MPAQLKAVRGATLVTDNTIVALRKAVGELLTQLASKNGIQPESILTVFFSVTPDLTAISPAKIARETLPWQEVALFCAAEPIVDGLPGKCVRVLIQYEPQEVEAPLVPVYINGAEQLRPDLPVNSN